MAQKRVVKTIEEFNKILAVVCRCTPIKSDVSWDTHRAQGYSLATHSFIEDLPDCIILRTKYYQIVTGTSKNFRPTSFIFRKDGISNVYYDPEQVAIISDSKD